MRVQAMPVTPDLPFLRGYPEPLLATVREALAEGRVHGALAQRYPEPNLVRNDAALYAHAMALKQRHLRNAPLLAIREVSSWISM